MMLVAGLIPCAAIILLFELAQRVGPVVGQATVV